MAAAAADLDLQDIHDTLVSIAFDAGRMILTANPSDIDQGTKLNCEFILLSACVPYHRITWLLHLFLYFTPRKSWRADPFYIFIFTPRCPSKNDVHTLTVDCYSFVIV